MNDKLHFFISIIFDKDISRNAYNHYFLMYFDHITAEESLCILMNKIKANLIHQMILFDTFKTNKRIIKQKRIGIQMKIIFYE